MIKTIPSLEECVKRTTTRKVNGDEWLFLKEPCNECPYYSQIKIHYCRSRKVYFKRYEDKNQLELPFPRGE